MINTDEIIDYVRLRSQLGIMIRTHRLALGLTQVEFGGLVGMHQVQVSLIENGWRRPSDKQIARVVKFLS